MFLLEVNPLVLPDIGLVFWNTIAFLVLLIVLGKFAWKPMLKAISERESGIEEALLRADKMKAEIAAMQNENEALLAKAREERAGMIKDAKETALPFERKEKCLFSRSSKSMFRTVKLRNSSHENSLIRRPLSNLILSLVKKISSLCWLQRKLR